MERIQRAEQCWQSWASSDPFAELRDILLPRYRRRWGAEIKAFAVDGGRWPPLMLVQFAADSESRFVTIGMSLRPQPNVELQTERPSAVRRIEMGIVFRPGGVLATPDQAIDLLAGQGRYPWRHWTWLGTGHHAKLTRPDGTFWNLTYAADEEWRSEKLSVRDDPLNLLWAIPLSDESNLDIGTNRTGGTQ
jgi:hypothetical protein